MTADQGGAEAEFQVAAQQLDALVRAFETIPFPEVREMAFDLLQAVDTLHRAGLGRLAALLHAQGQAQLLERAAQDPLIHALFLLYDLVPSDELTAVETALDLIRPYIHGHGGEVEVLEVTAGVVHLRLSGACEGCSGAATTLKRGVEETLRQHVPGFTEMVVHEPERPPLPERNFIPLTVVGQEPPPLRRPVFHSVAPTADVPPGTLRAFDVDGAQVLVANVAGELYAVRNTCPLSMTPLHLGNFTPPIIICPCQNEAYDVRSGKRADAQAGPGLAVLPIAIVDATIQLAVNTAPLIGAGSAHG
ncbi:MAG: NifU family protein [Chloroflexota bacterium]|nr:NifU family protein [Chloroflexota bacterium]